MNTKSVKNHTTGREFRVRIVNQGDAYGLNMQLTHDEANPLVEFYDATHDFDKSPEGEVLGQFISRYYLSTLLGKGFFSTNIFEEGLGLNLDAGVPAWGIDAAGISEVKEALIEMGAIEPDLTPIVEQDGPS